MSPIVAFCRLHDMLQTAVLMMLDECTALKAVIAFEFVSLCLWITLRGLHEVLHL